MITRFYDLYNVEEAFDVALKKDLTFKKLVNAKARCSSVRDVDIIIISALQKVDMLELCLVIMLI